ncbi:hypothetical protein SCHPADRAFT_373984 [Schizopora paradoxa]|uniref:Uncharacterized protein n=1 Tax=Schizopora paradoxa TaxID=27342 RepID=A0A0H2RN31_9AGAM|nr:hypothetical protein SCHPADRAFT_373984 [Schizopora paradoxa]
MTPLRPRFLVLATLCALAASPSFVTEADAYVLATRPSRAMLAADEYQTPAAMMDRSAESFGVRAPEDDMDVSMSMSMSMSLPVLPAPTASKSKSGKSKTKSKSKAKPTSDFKSKKKGKKTKGKTHKKGKKGRKGSRVSILFTFTKRLRC